VFDRAHLVLHGSTVSNNSVNASVGDSGGSAGGLLIQGQVRMSPSRAEAVYTGTGQV
jgi:hypothetical protein